MLFLALVLIGILSYKRLPVDLLPSITYPRLTVITTYADIPAEDLERLVTQPIEEVVTALSGVRRVVTRTREGVSMLTVEYEWGTQMDFANLHLREAIDRVAFREDFPEDADRPVILRWDPTSRPISILVLEGTDPIESLTDFAREVVKPALEQVDGISQAEVVGGADREILVEPDPAKLAIYGIEIEDIRRALMASNVSFPGGKIRQGPLHLSLRIAGEYETLREIEETEIPQQSGSTIRVQDVARVVDTVKEPEGATLLGSESVVSILIYKEPEANTIKVSEELDRSLEALTGDYGDFGYSFVYRDADYVRASFQGLVQSLIIGAVLAFCVLFFFLRDVRSPIVVGTSIPIAILITFALLYFGKVKLNLMSLGGLSLAAGMLVDNAIVVLENIKRHLGDRGAKSRTPGVEDALNGGAANAFVTPRVAERQIVALGAEKGTKEIARAVIAATLTTVAVFFPVVYVPGIAGAFFRDQALTVTFSLLVSVAAALLLQPMLAARVLRITTRGPRGLFKTFENAFNGFYRVYHGALIRTLRKPVPMLIALSVGLLACVVIGANLTSSFMPERSSANLRLELELAPGTPLEETIATTAELADWIEADDAVRHVFSQAGRTERTLAAMQDYAAPNTSRIRIILESGRGRHRDAERVQSELTERLTNIPEANFAFREEGIGLGEILSTGDAPFTLGVISEEPHTAVEVADALAEQLQDVDGLEDLQVDRVLGTPNLVVRLDREEILRRGLDPSYIATEVRNRISGVEATTFNEVEQRIDISVRLPLEKRRDLRAVLDSPVNLPASGSAGETLASSGLSDLGGEATAVPLRSLLKLSEERPVRELVRRNQRRMVSINGDVRDRSIGAVWKDAMKVADEMDMPGGVRLVQAGEQDAIRRSFQDLLWAMVLAILLVYMILAAQFESFLDPLLIAAVIPIGLAGATVAVWVTGGSLNILSLIGAVALLGIAVNDAIVKVDTMRRLRSEGMDGHAAVLEASRLRLRPILMTSATTVLALLPMAIGIGSGEQLQRPLAITIIGGLTLTTFLTLFYTPILYEVAHKIRGNRDVEEGAGEAA